MTDNREQAVDALLAHCDELLRLPTASAYPDGPCLSRDDHNELARLVVECRARIAPREDAQP